jgi:two-component system, NarL family, sensor kinase
MSKTAMTSSIATTRLILGILCGFIFCLEIIAPTEYIFGHLYILPLLLASVWVGSKGTLLVTGIAILLTILDFAILDFSHVSILDIGKLPAYIIVNRLNVVVVLLLTNWLVQRNFKYADKINFQNTEIIRHKAELSAQLSLAQMREDFVCTLTHDLKTPVLGAIQTIKSFQQEQFGEVNTLQLKVLSTMSQSQQRSLKLVETLLDIYRNDAEGLVLNSQPVNLRLIAKEAIDAVFILGLEREVKLNLKSFLPENQQMEVMADPLQLSRVFSNLLSNAIYYSPRAGQIDVTVYHHEYQYVVQVVDNGRGVAAADIPLLFDRFYQANGQIQGSGLGLYLSRQIIEAHGGKIWAEPELPQGTKFCFSLPVGT